MSRDSAKIGLAAGDHQSGQSDTDSVQGAQTVQAFKVPPGKGKDDLLLCLLTIAQNHDLHISSDAIISGLPLKDGYLTPGILNRAAYRAGLKTNIVKRSLDRLPDIIFPCIVLMNDRTSCVIFGREGDVFDVYCPSVGEEHFPVKKEALELSYLGYVVALKPIPKIARPENANKDLQSGHWFWSVIKSLWPHYAKVMLASFIINSLAIAAPLFMLNVYDRVLPNSSFSTLWILTTGMILVLAFDLILRMLRGLIVDRAGRFADVKLASRIFDHVLHIRLKDKPVAAGAFAARLTEFATVREFFSSVSLLAILDMLFIVLFLWVISLVGGPLVIVPIVAVILVLFAGVVIQPFMMSTTRSVQEESAQKHALLIETISNLDTIKSLNAEGAILKRYEDLVAVTAKSTEKLRFFSLNMINFTMIVQQSVSVAIVVFGTYLFAEGRISMGGIIATVILASRAVAPLGMVASTLSRVQQSIVALKNLNQIMDTSYENDNNDAQISRKVSYGEIEFRNVSFTYPNTQTPALQNVSFHIKPGEKVGIIGKVGAGKSTLSHLVASLYEPDEGSILLDGVNILQLHTADVRTSMGIVMQDVGLFNGTARENIAFGSQITTDEDVIKAAELSGASEFINNHPMGYGMQIGERGQFISGGQRQFIALARALVNDPPVLLLDEPTSAMDSVSELLFIRRLQAVAEDKTLILSTHRQSLLRIVDKLMLIDNGRVLAYGNKLDVLDYIKNMVAQEGDTRQTQKTKQKTPPALKHNLRDNS